MLTGALILVFLSLVFLVLSLTLFSAEAERPTLKLQDLGEGGTLFRKRQKPAAFDALKQLDKLSIFLRPLVSPQMRQRLTRDLGIARLKFSPETFFLLKIALIVLVIILLPGMVPADQVLMAGSIGCAAAFLLPEIWLKTKVSAGKNELVKCLPDVVDLLGLCVSAGLDFMMALKWVVEKAPYNIVVEEMTLLLQEISIGKPRRDALRDLAKKYALPDLSTFTRTLIQADKMGTSVSEALTILSEDMRIARFRRGEAMALKAPLKMLVPLLFFIFPVVGILVGGPIFMEFMSGNPLSGGR